MKYVDLGVVTDIAKGLDELGYPAAAGFVRLTLSKIEVKHALRVGPLHATCEIHTGVKGAACPVCLSDALRDLDTLGKQAGKLEEDREYNADLYRELLQHHELLLRTLNTAIAAELRALATVVRPDCARVLEGRAASLPKEMDTWRQNQKTPR